MLLKIEDLNNSFPNGLALKGFLDRDRFNPYGFTAMKV
jgi:hypothetical protein